MRDTGGHNRCQGLEDQGLVVTRQQLLRCSKRQGIEPRSPASRQDNSFAIHSGGSRWQGELKFGTVSLTCAIVQLKTLLPPSLTVFAGVKRAPTSVPQPLQRASISHNISIG